MILAREAQEKILSHTHPLDTEEASLQEASHRFLAHSICAPISLPSFDNSAMDGFVVGSGENSFRVIGTVAAGDQGSPRIHPGEAIRIMTGAPVPEGAYAVVPFEEWPITKPVLRGSHIRHAGEDIKEGMQVIEAGERVTSRTIALLAALGIGKVSVYRRPRVKILPTGNELVSLGKPLRPGEIYNSNGPALLAVLREMGIEVELLESVTDSEEVLSGRLKEGFENTDVLLTIGGVSAGDFDLVPKILKTLGAEIIFHRVAIKPGKPLLFATVGAGFSRPDWLHMEGARTAPLQIFGLPGNPVSALMVFDRFVRPALLKMMGARRCLRQRLVAIAAEDLKGSEEKEDYLRGIVTCEEGRLVARSAGGQGSANLLSLARANAILIVPESQKKIRRDEPVSFEFFEGDL